MKYLKNEAKNCFFLLFINFIFFLYFCGGNISINYNDTEVNNDATDADADSDSDADTDEDSGPNCIDHDGDNYGEGCLAGHDCDDTNQYVHIGAREICGNNIDEDCTGGDETCTACIFTRVDQQLGIIDSSAGMGTAFVDYDNDNDLDLYETNLTYENTPPNDFLYRNDGNVFTRVETSMGIVDSSDGVGVAFGDYDNDGDLDIYVSNISEQQDFLYRNDGNIFTRVDTSAGIVDNYYSEGIAWADYDNDGDLDIFVTNYTHDGINQPNILYRNDGGVFTRVEGSMGIIEYVYGAGVTWGDYDNDGDLDIFQVNAEDKQDYLYRNDGNIFTRVDTSAGIVDYAYGTGTAFSDFDNDGDLDLYIANYTYNGSNLSDFFFKNNGSTFSRIDSFIGTSDMSAGVGVTFGDYDNDGYQDLFVANWGSQNFLYRNSGSRFSRVDTDLGIEGTDVSTGVIFGDYDNDGDLDIFINSWGDQENIFQDYLYRNDCPSKSYIVLRPLVQNPNGSYRDAIGARVYVDTDGNQDFLFPRALMREVSGGSGYGSQNQIWLHFGLGGNLFDVAVKVIFPGPGTLEERTVIYTKVTINQRNILYQDGTIESF